jgi:hypothetical protein
MTARETLYQVVLDLPEEDCESFGTFMLAVEEAKPQSQLNQIYAGLPQSTHDSVQRTLSCLKEEEPRAS